MAVALLLLPFAFDAWLGSVDLFTRILIWGVFGLGFDLLFGRAGLLSFGQAAFYGTGGFVTAYLLTSGTLANVWLAIAAGIAAATAVQSLGRISGAAPRRHLFHDDHAWRSANCPIFWRIRRWRNLPAARMDCPACRRRASRSAGFNYSFAGSWPSYQLVAGFFFVGFLFARFVVLSPVGAVLTGIRQNPERTAALGHDVAAYKLAVFVIAAVFAGCAGALLGIFQSYMPPDAFALDTSGQLVIQTVMGGAGTLIGPAVGAAIWLSLRDVLQQVPAIGSLWEFILGAVFVLLVTFMPSGIVGTIMRAGAARCAPPPPRSASRSTMSPCRRGRARGAAGAIAADRGSQASAPARFALEARGCQQILRRHSGRRRDFAGAAGGNAARRHRSQRRRQEHVSAAAQARGGCRFRPHSAARHRYHGRRRHRGVSIRLVQELPDQSAVSRSHRAAEFAARRARPPTRPAAARRLSLRRRFSQSRSAGRRAYPKNSAWPIAPTSSSIRFPMARSAGSNSASPWHRSRRCCCSTSRSRV